MSKLNDWFFRQSKKSSITVGLLLLVSLAWFYFKEPAQKNINVEQVKNSTIGIANGTGASVNFYSSVDDQNFEAKIEKAQQNVKNYPDDATFRQDLKAGSRYF
jgi:hypothetical protein